MRLKGAADSTILHAAMEMGAFVLTYDEDFADARMYPSGKHAGVIRLRVWPTTTEATLARLFAQVDERDLPGSLIIIDETKIRIRRAAQHG